MCRSKVEKEEVFITQNASGGSNSATIQEYHLSNISIVLIVMCTYDWNCWFICSLQII